MPSSTPCRPAPRARTAPASSPPRERRADPHANPHPNPNPDPSRNPNPNRNPKPSPSQAGAYTGLQRDDAPHDLDLHGLSVGAAQQAVLWWLTEVQAPLLERMHERMHDGESGSNATDGRAAAAPPERLTIITGRGKHRQSWQRSAADGGGSSVREGVEAMLDQMDAPLVETGNSGTLVLDVARWLASFGDVERRAAEFAPPPTQAPPPTSTASTPPADLYAWEVVGGATSREIRLGPAPTRGVVHEMELGPAEETGPEPEPSRGQAAREAAREVARQAAREAAAHSSVWLEGSDGRSDARARAVARRERASSGAGKVLGKAGPAGAVEAKRSKQGKALPRGAAGRAWQAAAGGGEEAARGGSRHRQARRVRRRAVKKTSTDGPPHHALARSPEKKKG